MNELKIENIRAEIKKASNGFIVAYQYTTDDEYHSDDYVFSTFSEVFSFVAARLQVGPRLENLPKKRGPGRPRKS